MGRSLETPAKPSTGPTPSRILMALLAVGVLTAGLAAQPQAPEKPGQRASVALMWFHKMTPAERLKAIGRAPDADTAFESVVRDDLDLTLVERGSIESADATDIVSRVNGQTTVKWVVDDGAAVKKGDRLIELDDSALREQLHTQKINLAQVQAARLAAEADLKLARMENELAVRSMEIALKVARFELKKDDGTDAEKKEILELKVEQAQLALETSKLRGQGSHLKAEAILRAKASAEEQEAKRLRALEAQLAECVIQAPQSGVAVYYVPEVSRFGRGATVLAVGEPVREGQKLIRICGLERFTVLTRIPEADIPRVRVGQAVQVRVDAFPQRALQGRVKEVSPVASQRDWLAQDVKVYPVVVELPAAPPGLKPGMTAEVRIAGTRLPKVLQVPVGAVARIGRETFCYVRIDKELQERKVTPGARNAKSVEIKEGLKEGEEVLRTLPGQ